MLAMMPSESGRASSRGPPTRHLIGFHHEEAPVTAGPLWVRGLSVQIVCWGAVTRTLTRLMIPEIVESCTARQSLIACASIQSRWRDTLRGLSGRTPAAPAPFDKFQGGCL